MASNEGVFCRFKMDGLGGLNEGETVWLTLYADPDDSTFMLTLEGKASKPETAPREWEDGCHFTLSQAKALHLALGAALVAVSQPQAPE